MRRDMLMLKVLQFFQVPVDDDISILTGDVTEDLEKSVHILEEAKQDAQAVVSFSFCFLQ